MEKSWPEIKINSKEEVDSAINSFKYLVKEKDLTPLEIKECFFDLFGSFFHLYQYFKKLGWKGTWVDFPGGHEIPPPVIYKAQTYLKSLL